MVNESQRSEVKGQRLLVEERAKKFAISVIMLVREFPKTTDAFVIGKQLIRSSTSIGGNLAEGNGAVSKKDFLNYRCIARKSALESKHWLELVKAVQLAKPEKVNPLISEAEEIIKIISAIVLKLKSKNNL